MARAGEAVPIADEARALDRRFDRCSPCGPLTRARALHRAVVPLAADGPAAAELRCGDFG
jgi:hypothetical protein